MSELLIQQSTLESIANAVRAKKGTTDLIPVTSLATEIETIEAGGGAVVPSGIDHAYLMQDGNGALSLFIFPIEIEGSVVLSTQNDVEGNLEITINE